MTGHLGVLLGTTDHGAIRLVQWCVIAFIFLFFLRVIRAVWVEVRPPKVSAKQPRPTEVHRRGMLAIEVIAPLAHAAQRYEVDAETRIGRTPGCEIATTYDVYSSGTHARLFREDGRLYIEDLGSTNGTFVNSERIDTSTRLERGDQVQVGETVFEVTR